MTDYTLLYPSDDVPLERLARAALAEAGTAYVTVVAGAGSQALRVPAEAADRIRARADGRSVKDAPEEGAGTESQPASGASRSAEDSSGGESGRAAGRPAARPGGRAAKKATAKKTTSGTRSARSSSKEGDDK